MEALKVYCSGPIRGDTTFVENFRGVIETVRKWGATPLTEVEGFSDDYPSPPSVAPLPAPEFKCGRPPGKMKMKGQAQASDEYKFQRDMDWLRRSDCVVAELSGPSIGAGFEISYALYILHIPVLVAHHRLGKRLSAMLTGCDSDNLSVVQYAGRQEMESALERFLDGVMAEKRKEERG